MVAPSNVVRLPTAAARQPKQPTKALRAYRKANPWPGEYRMPCQRDAERAVRGLSAAEIVVRAMFEALPHHMREQVEEKVCRLHSLAAAENTQRAAVLVFGLWNFRRALAD